MTINRRNFLFSFGASATVPALASMIHPASNENQPRARVDLNGTWERLVQAADYDFIYVPSSNRPLGQSLLKCEFTLPRLMPGMRAFIHFEAIAYYGRVAINGVVHGAMGPYVP